jgi:hypothetical protein
LLGTNGTPCTGLCLEEELPGDRGGDGVDGDEGAAARNVSLFLLESFFTAQEENKNLHERRSRDIPLMLAHCLSCRRRQSCRQEERAEEGKKQRTDRRLSSASRQMNLHWPVDILGDPMAEEGALGV